MSDQFLQGAIVSSRLVCSIATRTALETPGVLRLEPAIQGFPARLAALQDLRHPGSQNDTYQHDGVTATISDGTVSVHLYIATDIGYTALDVAENVRQRLRESIRYTGLTPGRIDVTILTIEPRRGTTIR
ncbi:Asp23/Gls24 family envelope stress response protein [Arthrobacter sp. PM3]|uniref:Asp23/Gls24 family envelope stress response protein n=1 Tax=Arthrobacter sp. PM3 TaxID=2017685 RepID=UPI000E10CFDD|nr:Asp23/Gls24 family envelope stress response protein [Arthrobacter sp. PM3]AXJ10628.1 hypothetical protein CFN17_14150 [Arthrobacter sp. PM3]